MGPAAQSNALLSVLTSSTVRRVADDHVFFWKGVIAEPCFFDSKSLLTGVFSRNDSALHDRMVAAFKSNVYWMQYSQCQWNAERSEQ